MRRPLSLNFHLPLLPLLLVLAPSALALPTEKAASNASSSSSPAAHPEGSKNLRGAVAGRQWWQPRGGKVRTTWNGCTCREQWWSADGFCYDSCCDIYHTGNAVCQTQDPYCENDGMGYCQPADYQAATCEDRPEGWRDSMGWTCQEYRSHHWCTTDGHYGSQWNRAWGDFEDYTWHGKSAWDACCACGGGQSGTATCTDAPNWRDTDGTGCDTYARGHFCTPSGSPGAAWRDSWGSLADYSVNGVSAADACCACGGSAEKASEAGQPGAPRPAPPATGGKGGDTMMTTTTTPEEEEETPPEEPQRQPQPPTQHGGEPKQRFAANGCECAQTWTWYNNGPEIRCETGCCSVSNSAYPQLETQGEVCITSGQEACMGREPQKCEPASFCSDSPNWRDAVGFSCNEYVDGRFCNKDGTAGPAWEPSWGTFSDSASQDGKSAADACCGCGGGVRTGNAEDNTRKPHATSTTLATTISAAVQCTDMAGWTDSDGDTCHTYEMFQYCTGSGHFGNGWDSAWGNFDKYSNDGASALQACCACGGGASLARATTTAAPPQSDQCADTPDWSDKDGDTCEQYKLRGWCNSTGYGNRWEASWGTFDDYAQPGSTSAAEACCACGGGSEPSGSKGAPAPSQCTDTADWTDKDSDNCEMYEKWSWCTSDGGFGSGWDGAWGSFDDYAKPGSTSATQACCACGGGVDHPGGTVSTSTVAPAADVCTDVQGWVDKDELGCSTYKSFNLCTSTGGYGSGWKNEWGSFDDWTVEGSLPVYEACCACGRSSSSSASSSSEPSPVTTTPATTTTMTCTDLPNWVDQDEVNCYSYEIQGWCNGTGVGSGWDENWGSLNDWAKEGLPGAGSACCFCGGGSGGGRGRGGAARTTTTAAPTTTAAECTDVAGWTDKENLDCDRYVSEQWCTPSGGVGPAWRASWGTFSDWAQAGGSSADVACCGCGGGVASGGSPTTTAPPSTEAGTCHDLPNWVDKDAFGCADYVSAQWCTAQGYGTAWKSVWGTFDQNAATSSVGAQYACCGCGGGYFDDAPTSTTTTPGDCTDLEGWQDKDGDTCGTYALMGYCTAAGGYGLGWQTTWGTFDTFIVPGSVAAPIACCSCGGGTSSSAPPGDDSDEGDDDSDGNDTTTTIPTTLPPTTLMFSTTTSLAGSDSGRGSGVCEDSPDNWLDRDGDSCSVYEASRWCTSNGETGPGWNEEWGPLSDYENDGVSAVQVCCACGGGSTTNSDSSDSTSVSTTTNSDSDSGDSGITTTNSDRDSDSGSSTTAQPDCADIPNWADAEGDTCSAYAIYRYCTADGGYGTGWIPAWGTFQDYSANGKTAVEACCTCGGGTKTAA